MLKLRVCKLVTLALVFFLIDTEVCGQAERVVCSFSRSAAHRTGEYAFPIKDIPVELCTHVVFSRIEIDTTTKAYLVKGATFNEDWQKIQSLRQANPQLKLIISIQSLTIMHIASVEEQRKTLIENILGTMETLDLDGVEILLTDVAFAFSEEIFPLVEDLKSRFVAAGRPACEVIVLVEIENSWIDYKRLCSLVDFVHLIAFNDRKPVYRGSDLNPFSKVLFNVGDSKNLTLERAVQYWIDSKCPASKIVLTTVYMAQTYTLAKAKHTGQVEELTDLCSLSIESHYCRYNEFCQILKSGEWTLGWDDMEGLAPHAIQGDRWVAYENEASMQRKGEIARAKGLAGVFGVSLDNDDYLANCGPVYPLTKALRRSFLQTTD
uniref:GH18 domain-containing protein n=1 Tax=Anopheles dirus TaxID=7168 RepID=A0A182N4X6_9DIPT